MATPEGKTQCSDVCGATRKWEDNNMYKGISYFMQ
jgi:hypothetical protein